MSSTPFIRTRSSHRPALAFLAAAAVAVVATGCGGNSPSFTSSSGAAAGAKGGPASAYQFSACMRKHGVSNFPDPVVKTSANGSSVAIGITPSISGQPAFGPAQKACNHILGAGANNGPDSSPAARQARTRELIAFASCLRAHGFPNFPDPNANGELSAQTIAQAGINFHTPALLTAGKSCASVTHGQITPAQVVQAINHANGTQQTGTQQAPAP